MHLLTKIAPKKSGLQVIFANQCCRFANAFSGDRQQDIADDEEFRVLNLRPTKNQAIRKKYNRPIENPPRANKMPVDQDWGAVWPGPKTFHPAAVPLPVRQGFTPKGVPATGKFANAELMKIPNFLHLTPPVIKKQCEALKRFCTSWPEGLENEEKTKKLFPIEIITSDYCHGLPTIRNPLARIVSLRINLKSLELDKHATDKFLRLVGDRYDPETEQLIIVTDRCPLRKQNYDYAQYLLTALFHESWVTEDWESTKTEADMEEYIWSNNKSKKSSDAILNWGQSDQTESAQESYGHAVEQIINDGENKYNLDKYKEEVLKLLNIPANSSSTTLVNKL